MSNTLPEEIQLWEHTWKVLELFVNQVEDARRKDDSASREFAALYQLVRVCVDEVWRLGGFVSRWKPPGPWEHEQAVANPRGWDGDAAFVVWLRPAEALFTYLGDGEVLQTFQCPSWPDDPFVAATPSIPFTSWADDGLFPKDARQDAAEDGDYDLDHAWWSLWEDRKGKAEQEIQTAPRPADGVAASDAGAWYHPSTGIPKELLNGPVAGCRRLAGILRGIADDLPEVGACTPDTAREMATAYEALATLYVDLETTEGGGERLFLWSKALAIAPSGPSHPITERLDELTGDRIGYPDGTLRALRALEDTLTWAWRARQSWYGRRERRLRRVLDPFLDRVRNGLLGALAGQTGIGFVGALAPGRTATYASRKLVCAPASTKLLIPGQLVAIDAVGQQRGTLALVTGSEATIDQTLVRTTALWISIEPSATGKSGLTRVGAPVGGAVTLSATEVRRGWAEDRARDGVILGFRALWTRFRLLTGADLPGLSDTLLPTPVSIVTGSRGSLAWVETITGRTATLVVRLPPGSSLVAPLGEGYGVCFARPGELLLLRGEADGTWFQTAVEVADVEVTTEAAWISGDEPDFCCDPPQLAVITVLPNNLVVSVRSATLRRDFAGFGPRSLASGFLLPSSLDPDARSAVGRPPQVPTVIREGEMAVAARTLRQWLEMQA